MRRKNSSPRETTFFLRGLAVRKIHKLLLRAPPCFDISETLRSAHTVYLQALYGIENKQQLFAYTALTDWCL
jgi:hypothetical protein